MAYVPGEELGLRKVHVLVTGITVLPSEHWLTLDTMNNGHVTGGTLHLMVGHMIQMKKFRIIEALEEIGLPMAIHTGLHGYRGISLDGVPVAESARSTCFHHSSMVISQLATFSYHDFIGMAGSAVVKICGQITVLHMA